LNNAIRKNGKDVFKVDLIKYCKVEELDLLEKQYITEYKTLFPDGYNLTNGGKTQYVKLVQNNQELNEFKKRGRNFGYKHENKTKEKMSQRLKKLCDNETVKTRMKETMKQYYDDQKAKIISTYNLDDENDKYIKEVKNKTTGKLYNYIIKINGRKLTLATQNETLEQKYNRLNAILEKAKVLRNKSKND
jgi:hypothetical protein